MWQIGQEFLEVRGGYVPTANGKGTHVWNGARIVKKTKKRKGKQDERNAD